MAFQSFSLFTYSTNQTAWQARVEQGFFKNRLNVTAMVRQNDFSNPLAESNFKTSALFKSVMVNLRLPKLPVISIGYYPATQLYYVNNNKIRANVYYILNASAFYHYRVKGFNTNSTVLINRFFNQATDSGFIKNDGLNIYAAQCLFIKNLQLKAAFAINHQPQLRFYTLETGIDYSFANALKAGAGLKYNRTSSGEEYTGKTVMIQADLIKWRMGIQVQYEKSFLPNLNNKLTGIDFGRAVVYKTF